MASKKDRPGGLASIKHGCQRSLLSTGDFQAVSAFDSDPGRSISAVEAGKRRLPLVRAVIALGPVGTGISGPQLRMVNIIGKGLSPGSSPSRSTGLIGEGKHRLASLFMTRRSHLSLPFW